MVIINQFLKAAVQSPLALALRNIIDVSPTYYKNISVGSSCSDLFLWVNDERWKTYFDVMNITNLCFPASKETESVRVLIFNHKGQYIGEDRHLVNPLQTVKIDISALVSKFGQNGFGTFCILRDMPSENPFLDAGTCLSERGYVSYVDGSGGLKQYVHGNSYVLYTKPGQTTGYGFVRANFVYDKVYRVQTPLQDCDDCDCIFLNPSGKSQRVRYVGYNEHNTRMFISSRKIPSLAVDSVRIPKGIVRLEVASKVFMFRPVVKKTYQGGADFFHA